MLEILIFEIYILLLLIFTQIFQHLILTDPDPYNKNIWIRLAAIKQGFRLRINFDAAFVSAHFNY